MKEEIVKKRKWVVPAAFAFMGALLVLTFFSQTIMNRTLPEVAAQYTQSGTITARIRGSGNVVANENFVVKIDQPRLVAEVPFPEGEEVNIGDTLIVFSSADTSELDDTKAELETKELELEKWLIENSRPGDTTSGLVSAVQNARNGVTNAQNAVTSARNTLSDAQNALANMPPFSDADLAAARASNSNAQTANNNAQAAATSARATAAARQFELSVAEVELAALDPADPNYPIAEAKVAAAETALGLANATLTLAEQTASASQSAADATQNVVSSMESNRDARAAANANIRSAQQSVTDAQQGVTMAQQTLTDAQKALADGLASANVDSSLEAITLREMRKHIEDLKEKIAKLEKDGNTSEITSLVKGIVRKVNITPGNTAEPDTDLIIIEVVDRGYSLSITVSSDQASRVNIGDQAEVDRGWWSWGEDIRATLVNIRSDPLNPAGSRILTFSVSGDVESDMQLNVTLSQRSESYNIIVPNSAIRTDTNGDFVLIIMTRSTPVGNRHIATRADVNIIASDDTNTAISGALSGWDFVITRSNEPVDSGMQVRLVDNP